MKKLLLLFSLVAIISCSSSDDNSGNSSSSNSINPPSWIIGKWVNNNGGFPMGYNFKNNDFATSLLNTDNWVKPGLDLYNGTQIKTNVSEEKTDSYYKVSYTIATTTLYYHFVKISNTQIKEIISDPNGAMLYTKQ